MPVIRDAGIELLFLSGGPEEMGWEHGKTYQQLIASVVERFVHKSEAVFGVPQTFVREQAKNCLPYIPDRYIIEMRSLAEASGVDFGDILALNCIADIDALYMGQIHQCCNFILRSPATRDNLFLHGRNLDFPPGDGIVPQASVVVIRESSRSRLNTTWLLGWVGFVGAYTGANNKKCSIAEIGVPSIDPSAFGTPMSLLIRQSLEECSDAEAFANFMRSARRTSGYNIAVADAKSATALCIESTRTLFGVRKPRRGVLVVDDVSFCRETGTNRLTYPAGAFRYARIMQLVKQNFGKIGLSTALSILSDTYDIAQTHARGLNYNCICNGHTVQSVLFLLQTNELYVSQGSVPAPLSTYELINMASYESSHS